ncbi:hypothetical protein HJC23_004651 [Cyclotella cryptica]|uniref:ATP-dependent RNA helicase n=1 Tax=Cyclotella cryptica TaxID=29204 RepID=A0ABD3QEM5_9STRA|eukprot:CCRYP_005980-RB/>CCRYP_005980-RB protein AED:0.03 eAED:0.03 QI:399/1/1/1/1/1/4/1632/671
MSSSHSLFRPFTVLSIRTKCSHSMRCVFRLHRFRPTSSTLFPFPCLPPEATWNDFNRHSKRRCFSSAAHASSSPPPTFASFIPPLHPATLHALTHKLRHAHPTEIQTQSYAAAISGRDVLARARTGTGKTLAFLIPALENALSHLAADDDSRRRKNPGVAILVICPTRELAIQIHSTSQLLAASHSNSSESVRMTTQVMYGGVSKEKDVQKLEQKLPFVLVATPGRLLDHMENTVVAGERFGDILGKIGVLVLDEADRCLDMGFQKDMQRILQILNQHEHNKSPSRQTLLFSATIPKDLRTIMASALRKDYVTVDCVEDIDPTTHTNASVDQTFVTLPEPTDKMVNTNDLYRLATSKQRNNPIDKDIDVTQYRWISGLVDIIEDIIHVQNPEDYKLIVFFPTTATTQFFSYVFNKVYKIPVIEMHSQKHQTNRTSSSKLFRNARNGILFTTDVSARGVDYPNVTHVIQYGPAENRETYIHRLGRTGRANKNGTGILVLGGRGEERHIVGRELKGLNVRRNKRYQDLILGETIAKEGDGGGGINGHVNRKSINERRLKKIHSSICSNTDSVLRKYASDVYRSMLGYYTSKMKSVGMLYKVDVVEYVNTLALQMGFKRNNLPRVSYTMVQNIGLEGIRGLNVGDGTDLGAGVRNAKQRMGSGKSRLRSSKKNR